MATADGIIPVPVNSAGSRTSIRIMGAWVGLVGESVGREALIWRFR